MAITANVAFFKNAFTAALSDGRHIEQAELQAMAFALHRAGVESSAVQFEWHAGQRMITAGQQVALCAEMRRLHRELSGEGSAAA